MAAKVRDLASAQNLTSQASTVVSLSGIGTTAEVYRYLIARVAVDNSGASGAAPGLTVTDSKSNTWTVLSPANQDPGAASAGITCYIAYAKLSAALTTSDSITFTWGSGNPTAKAIQVEEWIGIDSVAPVAVAELAATGASTTPSVSRTPVAAGQVFYGALAIEGIAADTYTQDADTTDGSWVGLTSVATADATATNNAMIRGAYKIVTGTTAQTWNPTITNRDWAQLGVVFGSGPILVAGSQASGTNTANAGAPAVRPAGTQASETDTANVGTPATVTPSPGFSDDFNRADASSLGTSTSGHVWQRITNGYGIASNKAHKVGLLGMEVIDSGVADGYIQADIDFVGSEQCLAFRLSGNDANNFLMLDIAFGGATFVKTVAGAQSAIGATITTGVPSSGLHTIKVSFNGSALEAFVDGVSIMTRTDGFNATATKHGLGPATAASDLVSTYDNVVAGGVATGGTATEADTGQAGATTLRAAGAQATTTATALSGAARQGVAGSQATATATANAGTPLVRPAGAQATEADTANAGALAVRKAGSQATGSDTTNAGTPLGRMAGALVAETDTANVGTPLVRKPGAQASEAGTAQSGASTIRESGLQATETDSPLAGTRALRIGGAQATESDAALTGTATSGATPAGAQAAEADTAQTGVPTVRVAGSVTSTTSIANPGAPVIRPAGAQATETETANAGTRLIRIAGGQATTTASSLAGLVLIRLPGAQATETDTAAAQVPGVLVAGSQAVASASALHGAPQVRSGGSQATTTTSSLTGGVRLRAAGSQAAVSDSAGAGAPSAVTTNIVWPPGHFDGITSASHFDGVTVAGHFDLVGSAVAADGTNTVSSTHEGTSEIASPTLEGVTG